jgi:hypothetical protein
MDVENVVRKPLLLFQMTLHTICRRPKSNVICPSVVANPINNLRGANFRRIQTPTYLLRSTY